MRLSRRAILRTAMKLVTRAGVLVACTLYGECTSCLAVELAVVHICSLGSYSNLDFFLRLMSGDDNWSNGASRTMMGDTEIKFVYDRGHRRSKSNSDYSFASFSERVRTAYYYSSFEVQL